LVLSRQLVSTGYYNLPVGEYTGLDMLTVVKGVSSV
jgi:hypothetical protein